MKIFAYERKEKNYEKDKQNHKYNTDSRYAYGTNDKRVLCGRCILCGK